MKRYIIDWDFSGENNDYGGKSEAATELCQEELDGIRISRSTWMVEYDGSVNKLAKTFIAAVYKEPRREFVKPSRDGSGNLGGDHFNILRVIDSFHSDSEAIDVHFDPDEAIRRILASWSMGEG